jgi:hypothetical protein
VHRGFLVIYNVNNLSQKSRSSIAETSALSHDPTIS